MGLNSLKFGSWIERAAKAWALLAGAVLLSIMAVTSLNTLSFLAGWVGQPLGVSVPTLSGYEDFVSLAIAMAALGFMPWCQVQRGHIAIDLVADRLPKFMSTAMDQLWLIALAALSIFLAVWLGIGMLEARADNALSPILGWPRWPFFAPGIVSLALWAAVCVSQLFAPTRAAEPQP
ncbi:MAG: TRAP transporter small permease [Pseudomonadota bacterium]